MHLLYYLSLDAYKGFIRKTVFLGVFLLFIRKWSIWFLSLPFGDIHVSLCVFLWGKSVPPITSWFAKQKSLNISPLSFIIPHPSFPIATSLFLLLLPTFAFRSPMMHMTSWAGTLSTTSCSLL